MWYKFAWIPVVKAALSFLLLIEMIYRYMHNHSYSYNGLELIYRSLYDYFKSKNALSPDTAITPSSDAAMLFGFPGSGREQDFDVFTKSILLDLPVLQRTIDGRYWFSVAHYQRNQNIKVITFPIIVFGIFLIVVLILKIVGHI